jgi:peroxiredoxin Q/BCP
VENGFEVVGISSDSIRNHKAFAKSYTLPYRLLSDEDGIARKLMKVPNSFFGLLPGRVTFVIDKNGIVRKVFNSALSASSHVKEAISTVVK